MCVISINLRLEWDKKSQWNNTFLIIFCNLRARPSIKMRQTIKWCLTFFLKIVWYFDFDFHNLFWNFIKQSILAKQCLFCQTYTLSVTTITTIIESLEVGNEDHGVKGLKRSLKASMEARISAVEAYEYFTIASFLDVKYKDQFFWEDETASSTKALVHWLWKNLLQLSGKMQDTG